MTSFLYKFNRMRLSAILSEEIGDARPPFTSYNLDDDYDALYQTIIYNQYMRCIQIADNQPYFDSSTYDEIMSEAQAFEDAIEVHCAYCFQQREPLADDDYHTECDKALAYVTATKNCTAYTCT